MIGAKGEPKEESFGFSVILPTYQAGMKTAGRNFDVFVGSG
jgi:hypothetical protein